MKCWKCGLENTEGSSNCLYCGNELDRSSCITQEGKAFRAIFDQYGAEQVFSKNSVLINALGDYLPDSGKLRNQIRTVMETCVGEAYLKQLKETGRPDRYFRENVRNLITEEAGFSDKIARDLTGYFDEMIGWKDSGPAKKSMPSGIVAQAAGNAAHSSATVNPSGSQADTNARKSLFSGALIKVILVLLTVAVILAATEFITRGPDNRGILSNLLSSQTAAPEPTDAPATATPSPAPTPTPALTPTPTPTPTPAFTPTPAPTPTPTPTLTPTPTPTPTPAFTPTPAPTPTPSPEPTATATPVPKLKPDTGKSDYIFGFDIPASEVMAKAGEIFKKAAGWTDRTAPQTLDEFPLMPSGVWQIVDLLEKTSFSLKMNLNALNWEYALKDSIPDWKPDGYGALCFYTAGGDSNWMSVNMSNLSDRKFSATLPEGIGINNLQAVGTYSWKTVQLPSGYLTDNLWIQYMITKGSNKGISVFNLSIDNGQYRIQWTPYDSNGSLIAANKKKYTIEIWSVDPQNSNSNKDLICRLTYNNKTGKLIPGK